VAADRLILWDIDRTLIDSGGVGRDVFRDALQKVTGRTIDEIAEVGGRTEPAIFRDTLRMHGIEDTGGYFPAFLVAQAEGYLARAGEMRRRGRVLPGAREAVEAFSGMPGITQSVLTGNPRTAAEIKLGVFGLDRWVDFDSGAYGSDDAVRPNLVAIARRRASERNGAVFTAETTVLIGDTTKDVEAALTGGARIVAVASGHDSAERLRQSGAPVVLDSLADTAQVIRCVTEA
jgi:phosphoglycolate phosphatase-like HAD superfamily hydrolase